MKVFSLAFTLGLLLCSCSSLERNGLAMPKPQSSEHMEVVDSGFVLKPTTKTVVLSVEVEAMSPPSEAKFLRVSFPDTETKAYSEVRTIPLESGQQRVRSSALLGLKYLDAYPIRIQLSEDEAGERIVEELTQYVRFEVPLSALAQMGVNL